MSVNKLDRNNSITVRDIVNEYRTYDISEYWIDLNDSSFSTDIKELCDNQKLSRMEIAGFKLEYYDNKFSLYIYINKDIERLALELKNE